MLGRKPLKASRRLSKRLMLRFKPNDYRELRRQAEAAEMDLGSYCRAVLLGERQHIEGRGQIAQVSTVKTAGEAQ